VRLAGPSDDVAGWLAAANLVVQPSRWEGFPLSVLEALASSRGVVATDAPGLRDLARSGVGTVVPPDDAVALRDAIAARLADPGLAEAEGSAGREWVERRDQRHQLDEVARLYEELVARRR
jgi:glycosyltransferase involved in cell wall biosynthesis